MNKASIGTDILPDLLKLESSPWIEREKLLSESDIESFRQNGYSIVSGLVSNHEIDEIIADAIKLARGGYPCEKLTPVAPELTDDQALRRILCIHQPHFISSVIQKYVAHPGVCGVLSQLTGCMLPWWDGSVKCMQSMLFIKPPTFQGQAWHQDEVYIPTRDRSLIGAWIALDDATIENGCLWVIPGSHRTGYLFPQRPHDNPDEFDSATQSYGFDDAEEVPVEVKKGTVVFFNGYLLHRSARNRSDVYRKVLVNHYCNAWSTLPWQYEEGIGMAKQDTRTIVPVAGRDPYSWKGTVTPENQVYLRSCKATNEVSTT